MSTQDWHVYADPATHIRAEGEQYVSLGVSDYILLVSLSTTSPAPGYLFKGEGKIVAPVISTPLHVRRERHKGCSLPKHVRAVVLYQRNSLWRRGAVACHLGTGTRIAAGSGWRRSLTRSTAAREYLDQAHAEAREESEVSMPRGEPTVPVERFASTESHVSPSRGILLVDEIRYRRVGRRPRGLTAKHRRAAGEAPQSGHSGGGSDSGRRGT